MQITDLLAQVGGPQALAKTLGVSESDAMRGASALLPALLGGVKKQTEAQSAGLGGLFSQLAGSGVFDQVLGSRGAAATDSGNDILGQLFGSKEVSRTVAEDAAGRSGLDVGLLKKMLPILAMAVAGYMNKGGSTAAAAPSSGGVGGLLGGLLGGNREGGLSGLMSMLDSNGDGNPLDDILRVAGKVPR